MANRHDEFVTRGGRVFAISADTHAMNAAMVEKLALPFPFLSDADRSQAITPLGFADEKDPRQIARPGVVVISPAGEVVYSFVGRDYADRPVEDVVLEKLESLGLSATDQESPELGKVEAGEKAMPLHGLSHYFRGAKFAGLALRKRYREDEDFAADVAGYVEMIDRYLEALPGMETRKG